MVKSLNSLQRFRWEAAQKIFKNLIKVAKEKDCMIMFDGEVITVDQIRIDDAGIAVVAENCTFGIFEADPEVDEGMYENISVFYSRVRNQFKLVKNVNF